MPPIDSVLIPRSRKESSVQNSAAQGSGSGPGLGPSSFNLLAKLNPDFITQLKTTTTPMGQPPKLICRNGEISIKLDSDRIFRLKKFEETSKKLDLYRRINDTGTCIGLGQVDFRLTASSTATSSSSKMKTAMMTEKHNRSLPQSPQSNASEDEEIDNTTSTTNNNENNEINEMNKSNAASNKIRLIHLLSLEPSTPFSKIKSIIPKVTEDELGAIADKTITPTTTTTGENAAYTLKDELYTNLSLDYYTQDEQLKLIPVINEKLDKLGYPKDHWVRVSITREVPVAVAVPRPTVQKKAATPVALSNKKSTPTPSAPTTEPELNANANTKTKTKTKKKRTISESSVSSINSMKEHSDGGGSGSSTNGTSPEEIDEDVAMSQQYKKNKTAAMGGVSIPTSIPEIPAPSVPQLTSTQLELYHKFQAKYQQYKTIHNKLSLKTQQTSRSRSDFKKLQNLELEVKTMKRKLWKHI